MAGAAVLSTPPPLGRSRAPRRPLYESNQSTRRPPPPPVRAAGAFTLARKPTTSFTAGPRSHRVERGPLASGGGGGRTAGGDGRRDPEKAAAFVGRSVACRAERDRELAAAKGAEGYVVPERATVAAMVALAMCLCNADRVVMSVAVVPLAARHGWSSSFLGIVQSSFMWGYIVSSAVGGALADRYGGKRVMAGGVAAWSLATFLTPWAAAHSTAALLLFRVLFGLAEGVAVPSMNIILSRWFPAEERASAVGFAMAGFHLGNVVGFLATPVIMGTAGTAGPFVLFAALGFAWVSACAAGVADDPRGSRGELRLVGAGKRDYASAAEMKLPPLRRLLSKMPSWAIIFANAANNWGYFVLLSWMPVYFRTVYAVDLKEAAWLSALPWGLMAISGYLAGSASDVLIGSGRSVTLVRKLMQSVGFVGPGAALLCLNRARTPAAAALLLTLALCSSSFSQAGFLLNVQDIAPAHAGFLHGISNAVGTLAAIIGTIAAGYCVQRLGSFRAFLTVTAGLYFVAAVLWNIFATAEQVFFF